MSEAGQRIVDYDGTWFQGVKSDADPNQLPLGYAWSAINAINLGGVMSCRPGQRCIATLPDGNLQGAALFRPLEGLEQIMIVVNGVVYVAVWPFTSFSFLPNVQFSPTAKQIFWALTTQSAERNTEDLNSAITVIPSKIVMIMQDGGETAPAFYDGSHSGHIRGHAFDTPSGGPMNWVGDRLWVATGNQVFASDISNPFSFRENIYLGGATSFFFADEVTAMVKTPSIESPQLMVFTSIDASILEANIRTRADWPNTVNFQSEILQVGTYSQRSVLSHYGQVIWFSPSGVAIFDPATSGKLTSRLPVRDNEMMVSKTVLDDDLSLVAAGAFGQFVCMSVPAEDIYNRHTWVLNHAAFESLNEQNSGPSWCGQWTGTRPVEWVYGKMAGADHAMHISVDYDGKNRLWESFLPNRLDNGCPITWGFATRGHFGQTAPAQSKLPAQKCRLQWIDVGLVGVAEDIDIGAFYAGGTRGSFQQFLDKKISVAKGSLNHEVQLDINSEIFSFKPQSRTVRTEDANQKAVEADDISGCGVERDDDGNIDYDFQFFIVVHGPATVTFVRSFALTVPEDKSGNSLACQDEATPNAVRYDGAAVAGGDAAELAAVPEQHFVSTQTVSLTQSGFQAIGVGSAESVVSQRAADRVAQIIATRGAEIELLAQIPPTLSAGLGLENVG